MAPEFTRGVRNLHITDFEAVQGCDPLSGLAQLTMRMAREIVLD